MWAPLDTATWRPYQILTFSRLPTDKCQYEITDITVLRVMQHYARARGLALLSTMRFLCFSSARRWYCLRIILLMLLTIFLFRTFSSSTERTDHEAFHLQQTYPLLWRHVHRFNGTGGGTWQAPRTQRDVCRKKNEPGISLSRLPGIRSDNIS
jgi:hypothetical protein